jgi:hypothetical protein
MNADDLRTVAAEIRDGHQRCGDAEEMAKWNPAVTGAVADWLDAVADRYRDTFRQLVAVTGGD